MRYACFLLVVTSLLMPGGTVTGQVTLHSDDEDIEVYRMTVSPAAAPVPALRYRLLPGFMERIDGNAAVYLGKVKAEASSFFGNKELRENINRWQSDSLDQLRAEKARVPGMPDHGPFYFLHQAARCEYCDWQLPIRREPFYPILLPAIQEQRSFARLLSAAARIHIANGELDDALKMFRTSFALARHVAAGETLVNGLVGIAICGSTMDQLQEFMQQPDSPSLYWALTSLPSPMIDLREAVETEMHAVELSFADIRDLESAERDPEEWRASLYRFGEQINGYVLTRLPLNDPVQMTALCVKGYPRAKRSLISQGMDRDVVEAMPVAQVIMIYTMRTYHELRDDLFKWYYMPYLDGRSGIRDAQRKLAQAEAEDREIIPLASILLPALQACRNASVRNERDFSALRVIEALRLHARANNGKLPARLSELTIVPMPRNPATDEPFVYRLNGKTAILDLPHSDGLRNAKRFEITIRLAQ